MESALDVLSRAATMVQDNANEARLTSKELPTTKWRRDRRLRTGEYHTAAVGAASSSTASPPGSPTPLPPHPHASLNLTAVAHAGMSSNGAATPPQMSIMMAAAAAAAMRPLCESTNRPTPPPLPTSNTALHMSHHNLESPIDMSVSSTTMKPRSSPPPPYREPLPGSSYATSLARPSVITQAPPKRGDSRDSILISNRENDNRSTESISMCETVIDEHFRRSLGPDYVALFGKKSPAPNLTPSPQPVLMATTTTPTPPPPSLPAIAQHHHPAPPYNLHMMPHPQALISPKPTAMLLSPACSAMVSQIKSEPNSPHMQSTLSNQQSTIAGPQQKPLSLHRSAHSPIQRNAPHSPQPLAMNMTTGAPMSLMQQRLSAKSSSPSPPSPNIPHSSAELHSTTHSATPSPRHSPAVNNNIHTASLPAIMRIKTEPGLSATATHTPPASPTSSTPNASISANSDILASVDDHFAKALGDTWKKLQENKDMRK